MSLDTLHKVLDNLIINFIAEHGIVLNNQSKKTVIVINLRIIMASRCEVLVNVFYSPGRWHRLSWPPAGRGS